MPAPRKKRPQDRQGVPREVRDAPVGVPPGTKRDGARRGARALLTVREFAAARGVTERAVRYWLRQGLPSAVTNPVRLAPAVAHAWAERHTTPDSPYSHGGRRTSPPAAERVPVSGPAVAGAGAGSPGADTNRPEPSTIDLSEPGLERAIAAGTITAASLDLMREALKVRAALRADAESQRALLRVEEVEQTWSRSLARLRSALDTLPARTATRLQTELAVRASLIPPMRRIVEEELRAVLEIVLRS